MMLLTRISGPALPVSLSLALQHLREPQDEATYLQPVLSAATGFVSEKSGRTLGAETWEIAVSQASGDIELPKSPVQSVTSISYYDAAGVAQTVPVADYYLFKDGDRARLRPKDGKSWPPLQDRDDALTIRFVAGYTTLPAELQHAILMMTAHFYQNRSSVEAANMIEVPMSVEALVSVHRIGWFAG